MDAIIVSALVLLALIAGIALTLLYLGRRARTALVEVESAVVKLPVVAPKTTCATCMHFSLEAGQDEMRRNPAFMAALQVLPLWKMSRPREIEWHPAYAPLDKKLRAAIEAKDQKRVMEVQKEIDALDIESYGREKNPREYVPPEALAAKPQDFGACAAHSELRSMNDRCDSYAVKAVSA